MKLAMYISHEDPCPCSSGKRFIDCCWRAGQYPPLISRRQLMTLVIICIGAVGLLSSLLLSVSLASSYSDSGNKPGFSTESPKSATPAWPRKSYDYNDL